LVSCEESVETKYLQQDKPVYAYTRKRELYNISSALNVILPEDRKLQSALRAGKDFTREDILGHYANKLALSSEALFAF